MKLHIFFLALAGSVPLAASAAVAAGCATTTAFPGGRPALSGIRVFTGPDGESHLEKVTYASKSYPFSKSGPPMIMTTTPLVASSRRPAMLVVAPAGLSVDPKPSPEKEMIVLLEGSSTVTTSSGSADLKAGMFVIFDDAGSKGGHGGKIGGCGYVGLALFPD